jgi:hypothetical protein
MNATRYVGEADHGPPTVVIFFGGDPFDLGAVGDCVESVSDVERDPKHGLELGLVPTRKGSSAVG